jgi:hypothetical protein
VEKEEYSVVRVVGIKTGMNLVNIMITGGKGKNRYR